MIADHGEIARVPLDGSEPEIWVSYTGRLFGGLTCDRKNRIFAAGIDFNNPTYVVMVTAKDDPGTPLPVPSGNTQLLMGNGIVAIDRPEGLLVYVSDNSTNLIGLWKELPDGQFEATIAATNVVGANGLAYDPKTNKLYAGGSQANNVSSFEIAQDGSLGAPQVVWTRSEAGYVDGISIDENGVIYVASWTTGEVIRTSDEKVITTEIVNPTSFAFRGGTMLITDFKILAGIEGGLYTVDLGVCGAQNAASDD
jgi:sugar lactone lactonase YvrE